MSAPSPGLVKNTQVNFTIKVENRQIPDTYQIVSIDTWSTVNKVPRARLVIMDGSPVTQDFDISSKATFLPGNRIQISAGYLGQAERAIFDGVIVKQGIQLDQTRNSRLVVEIWDRALQMTLERKSELFPKIRDSDLITKLISGNGLKAVVAATSVVHEEIVQYYATDWDLMLTRAEMNGFVVTVQDAVVSVGKPDTQQQPALSVKYGESLLDLQAEMDATTQCNKSAVKSYAWDATDQKLIEAGPGAVQVKEPGNVSSDTLAKVFGVKNFAQQTGAMIEQAALQAWSSAELLRSKLSKIRGFARFQGSALAEPGKTIELGGLGDRFNGSVYVSGVHHNIQCGRWLTTVDFGLSSKWFAAEAPHIAAPDAAGQLPPIKGLQTGIVKQVWRDPAGEYRVLVVLPLLQNKNKGVWARLGTFYASKKFGAVFFPEVDDEVIVAFMNEDPRYPVILGSVYSKQHPPAYPPDEKTKNAKKAVVTKSKLQITFDDQDKIIQISTPGKHTIKLDDKTGAISIKDSNKNTVSLSKGGITLDSGSHIKITAKGNITLDAKGNLSMKAAANSSMEGVQIAHKAKAKFSAKGNATAEVTASGPLTIRGALVKIN